MLMLSGAYWRDANTSYYYGFFELQPASMALTEVWQQMWLKETFVPRDYASRPKLSKLSHLKLGERALSAHRCLRPHVPHTPIPLIKAHRELGKHDRTSGTYLYM